jgi:tetratricopeptide (TPR) repeat protein
MSNAFVSYIIYIEKTFWPSGLAIFYPYPETIAAWKVWVSLALLVAVSVLVMAAWRTFPYLAVGWFWYLGMMVPVVGFIQTGFQSRADRYTYLPMVGLSVMLAWGGADLIRRWPKMKPLGLAAAALAVVFSIALAWKQTTYWQNSETLYEHALQVTEDNWLAHGNLAEYLTQTSARRGEAIAHLETAIRIRPNYPSAHNNLGVHLAQAELCASAIPHFEIALREIPNDVGANGNLGICLMKAGRYDEAVRHFRTALHVAPSNEAALWALGMTLAKMPGREDEAIPAFEAALKVNPKLAEAHRGLGEVLLKRGNTNEAILHFAAAQRIHPDAEVGATLERLRLQGK